MESQKLLYAKDFFFVGILLCSIPRNEWEVTNEAERATREKILAENKVKIDAYNKSIQDAKSNGLEVVKVRNPSKGWEVVLSAMEHTGLTRSEFTMLLERFGDGMTKYAIMSTTDAPTLINEVFTYAKRFSRREVRDIFLDAAYANTMCHSRKNTKSIAEVEYFKELFASNREKNSISNKTKTSTKSLEQLVKRPEMIDELWKSLEEYNEPFGKNIDQLRGMLHKVSILQALSDVLIESNLCVEGCKPADLYHSIAHHLNIEVGDRPRVDKNAPNRYQDYKEAFKKAIIKIRIKFK
jgi:hypothetical protein